MSRFGDRVLDATDRMVRMPRVPALPPGGVVTLPGRGHTYVTDTGGLGPVAGQHAEEQPAAGPRPTLVLLHALACTGLLTWYPSLDVLSKRYRLVIFDQRWHGQGIRSPQFVLDELADDVVAVADALGIDTFFAAGFSLGSLVAQLVARRHPDRIDGMVLCAGTTHFGTNERTQAGLRSLSMRATRAGFGLQMAASGSTGDADSPQGRWAWQQFRSTSGKQISGAAAVISGFDSRGWIGEQTLPTSVVVTARDRLISPERQRALARSIPGATIYEAPSGHASCVIGAERFTPALVAACASVATRAGTRVQP